MEDILKWLNYFHSVMSEHPLTSITITNLISISLSISITFYYLEKTNSQKSGQAIDSKENNGEIAPVAISVQDSPNPKIDASKDNSKTVNLHNGDVYNAPVYNPESNTPLPPRDADQIYTTKPEVSPSSQSFSEVLLSAEAFEDFLYENINDDILKDLISPLKEFQKTLAKPFDPNIISATHHLESILNQLSSFFDATLNDGRQKAKAARSFKNLCQQLDPIKLELDREDKSIEIIFRRVFEEIRKTILELSK